MNMTGIFAVVVLVFLFGAYAGGRADGRRLERAEHQKITNAIEDSARLMRETAALEIAKIEVKNVYTTQRLEKEIVEKPVYTECGHSDAAFSVLTDAFIAPEDRQHDALDVVPEADTAQ
jgi:hypothetical protein